MLIEFRSRIPSSKMEQQQQFLIETHSLITTIHNICAFLSGDMTRHFDSDYKAMGMSLEECLLFKLEEILENLQVDHLTDLVAAGGYITGPFSSKYLNAYVSAQDILADIEEHVVDSEAYTLSRLKELRRDLTYAEGDLVYAFSRELFNPTDARTIAFSSDTFTYTQAHTEFFSRVGMKPEEYANFLARLGTLYVSVIPLFADKPEEWIELTKGLESSVVSTLVDYGTYITEFDIRAMKLGVLLIDENFIDELLERSETGTCLSVTKPSEWLQFTRSLTDQQIKVVLPFTADLTIEDIKPVLEEGKLTDSHLRHLVTMHGGSNYAGETDFF